MELPLTKDELLRLEKQEKQLRIIEEELKMILDLRSKNIIQCKKRLQLKEAVGKVLSAIRGKNT